MCFSISFSSKMPLRTLRSRTRTSQSHALIVLLFVTMSFFLLLDPGRLVALFVPASSVHVTAPERQRHFVVVVVAIGTVHVLVGFVELRRGLLDLVVRRLPDLSNLDGVAQRH